MPLIGAVLSVVALSACQARPPIVLRPQYEPPRQQIVRRPAPAQPLASELRNPAAPSACERVAGTTRPNEREMLFEEFEATQADGSRPRLASRPRTADYCRPAG